MRTSRHHLRPKAQTARRAGLPARSLHPHAAAQRGTRPARLRSGLAQDRRQPPDLQTADAGARAGLREAVYSPHPWGSPLRGQPSAVQIRSRRICQELLGQVDNETTILMGHTRWRTRGNEFNNRNNHPIRAGIVIGTHNGTIYNADYLFRRLGLPRYAEVDSELIFRLADRFAPEGPIDQEGLKKALALCRGQMSAVLASRLDPGTITVLKGNKPLCLRIHRQHRVVLYASDDAFIDFAVDNEKSWRELEVPPMTMLTIRHEDVRAIENSEFRFIPQERKGTLPKGVNA
ncbi:hypothetical protein [Thiohalocapsa marina]|uniref:hypothetical protein n=1 Tax=Thiohalocapsa marina TaxID=424902 RepID=UPI0024828699|nr:hypothetical protein [Thiohalocapsa marina]